jgi:hypothetical protein
MMLLNRINGKGAKGGLFFWPSAFQALANARDGILGVDSDWTKLSVS